MTVCRARAGFGRVVTLVLAVSLAVGVSALAAGCGGGGGAAAPTARVERGTVANKVSASGALSAVTSQNLAFPKGGVRLTQVNVKVGDRVQPGQVLAREDDFAFRQALNQAQAQLDNQQALLDKLTNSNPVEQAHRTLDQARKILDATQQQTDEQVNLDKNAIDRAHKQVSFDQRQAEIAQRQLGQCLGSGGSTSSSMTQSAPTSGSGLLGALGRGSGSGGMSGAAGSLGGAVTGSTACTTQQSNWQTTKRTLIADQTALEQAQHQRDVDEAKGRVSEENARQSVVSAQNGLDTAERGNPADIDARQALVDNARAQVALAQKDVDNSVLYAPVAGTVSAINGSVGEFVGGGATTNGTTAKAPGTNAEIPGVGAAATSDASSSSVTGAPSATRPGGQAFIILNDVNSFQVVVPFEESDAAKVKPNQQVQVTFDAIPDLTVPGTVLSIAPSGTAISGVTNYYATILLSRTDPRLKAGQTAQAGVMVNAVNDVLVVPNSAVIKQGGRSLVNVPGPDGKPIQVPFQPGAVGDDTTQVVSGLREGQQILLPQTPAPNQTAPNGRGGR